MASSTSYAGSRSPADGLRTLKELLLVERGELLLQPLHLRQVVEDDVRLVGVAGEIVLVILLRGIEVLERRHLGDDRTRENVGDRKSTRLNSSHSQISYAVFCLKKKNTNT